MERKSTLKLPPLTPLDFAPQVVKESYVDHTQFDRADPHFDPKSSRDNPKGRDGEC